MKNVFYGFFYRLVVNEWFNLIVYGLIVVNTVTISMYTYDQDAEMTRKLNVWNIFFSAIFLLEMVFKLIGLGFKDYFSDRYNFLDSFVVLMGIIDISLEFSPVNTEDNLAIQIVKSFRILRIFKLSRVWEGFREVMS